MPRYEKVGDLRPPNDALGHGPRAKNSDNARKGVAGVGVRGRNLTPKEDDFN